MSAVLKDGGPAFPLEMVNTTERNVSMGGEVLAPGMSMQFSGMTLRDYFAAKMFPIAAAQFKEGHIDGWNGIARHAYMLADAMLKARPA